MRRTIAITGSRTIERGHELFYPTWDTLCDLILPTPCYLLVGDCSGVDAIAWEILSLAQDPFNWSAKRFEVEGYQRHHFRQRSEAMLKEAVRYHAELHAFPAVPCPRKVSAKNWAGHGTWGTACKAKALGLDVVVHHQLSPWRWEQLSLF